MIKEIKKKNLAEIAYDRIMSDVISSLAEGDKIPSENTLSKSLGVSRAVIREALLRLRDENVIATFHGRGSFVANPSNFTTLDLQNTFDFKEFCEVMEFRSCIEYTAIKRAVSVAGDTELLKLREIAEKMEESVDDQAAFSMADYRFHLAIAELSHNSRFVSAMVAEEKAIFSALEAMNSLNDSRLWGAQLHKKIADRIIARDAKGAIDILKLNGEYNMARMHQVYDNHKK